MTDVVTRFAPSPTGLLHLGNVRTALLNWLYAHKHGGRFLLRFEDTDKDRSEQQFIQAIQKDLHWLGLNWDGEVLFQSQHADDHRSALHSLAEKGLAYRCFCSESQLAIDRKLATSRGLPPRYNGRCRELPHDKSEQRAVSEPFVWRLAVHRDAGSTGPADNHEVIVADALRGDVRFALRDLDDPVVVRSDGSFTFLLPNAVDDALDGITHVMRGDDHLTNSAYQVWLLQKLGYRPPVYLHHGLLLGADGAKLSKRSGSHSVAELRVAGLLPAALIQTMTRLGHPNLPDDDLNVTMLATHFKAEHVSTSSVRWSDDEMWRWHTRILHQLPVDELLELILQHIPGADAGFAALVQPNLERVEDAVHFSRMLDVGTPFLEESQAVAVEVGAGFYREALRLWASEDLDWKSWAEAVKGTTGRKGRSLFMPLRAALTGALHGPEMSAVLDYIGRRGVEERLQDTISRLSV